MMRLVRSELLKVWTTKAWWLIGLAALVITGLVLAGTMFDAYYSFHPQPYEPPPGMPPEQQAAMEVERQHAAARAGTRALVVSVATSLVTAGSCLGVMLVMLMGILIVTNEFHHQTATTTFLTTPRRTGVISAKLITALLIAVAFWLVTTVVNLIAGAVFLSIQGKELLFGEWSVIRAILLNLAAYSCWAVLGIGLAVLIRSQIGTVVTGVLVYLASVPAAFIAFGAIRQFLIKDDWVLTAQVAVPSIASMVMTSTDRLYPEAPPQWVGALVLVGYGLVAGVIGTLITRRRDIS